jgi:hypothetical protein
MDMNLNSVYQKCELCEKRHSDDKDVFECYSEYLVKHPKNVDVEIWDIDKKIWIKRLKQK